MTTSIIVALITIINAFLLISNASAQNAYSSRNRQNSAEPDSVDMNSYDRNHHVQLSNFGNGNYKHNVINVDQTSNGFSVSSYEADRNIRPTSTNYNVNLNNPDRTTVNSNGMGRDWTNGMDIRNKFSIDDNRQEPRGTQSRFYQNGGSINRQQILREILEKAKIGTGNNNNNQIYVNGERIDLYPNRAEFNNKRWNLKQGLMDQISITQFHLNNHATDEAVVSGQSSVDPTQILIVIAVVLKIKIL